MQKKEENYFLLIGNYVITENNYFLINSKEYKQLKKQIKKGRFKNV